jgi:hypothetical protein
MEPKFTFSNHPKIRSGFEVPDGYFEQFPEQLMRKVPATAKKVVVLKRNASRWYIVAASLMAGIVSLTYYQQHQITLQDIDAVTIENYLTYHASVTEEEIVNLMDEKDLEKMKLDLNIADKDLEEALDETPNIEQYLIN